MCEDCLMITPIDSYNTGIKHHQHALIINKKSMINHTLAVVVLCVLKKSADKRLR